MNSFDNTCKVDCSTATLASDYVLPIPSVATVGSMTNVSCATNYEWRRLAIYRDADRNMYKCEQRGHVGHQWWSHLRRLTLVVMCSNK